MRSLSIVTICVALLSCGCDGGSNGESGSDAMEPLVNLSEACGGYAGSWDCIVTEGVNEGMSVDLVIQGSNIEYHYVFHMSYEPPDEQSERGMPMGKLVCDGQPPAETEYGGYFYPPNEEGKMVIEHTHTGTSEFLDMECTRHPTD